jgi:hypothetical protein
MGRPANPGGAGEAAWILALHYPGGDVTHHGPWQYVQELHDWVDAHIPSGYPLVWEALLLQPPGAEPRLDQDY